jgi:hypothetical protein
MPAGGYREGSGRKTVAAEEKTRSLCKAAIAGVYGSVEDGLKSLLLSQEPALVKFVFEHALGKPPEDIDLKADGKLELIVKYEDRGNTEQTSL